MTPKTRLSKLEERIRRSPFQIAIALGDQIPELGAFRYKVYVEQAGKSAAHANHSTRSLIEPLDFVSTNLLARDANGSLIGCARITTGEAGSLLPPQADPAQWSWVPQTSIAFVSRLMVDRTCRNPILMPQLFRACFEWGLRNDIRLCTVFSAPALVALFHAYGCVAFDEPFFDEFAGWQVPLLSCLADYEGLSAVGSPFISLIGGAEADFQDLAYMQDLRDRNEAVALGRDDVDMVSMVAGRDS